jgi:hypothetical protein
MLANFLDKSKPINFIGLFVFFFISFSRSSYLLFLKDDFSINNLLDLSLFLLFFICIFFFYNFILSKNKLTFDNSYGYFIFSLLVICILPTLFSYKTLFLFLFYTLFLRKIYSLKSNKNVLEKLFDIGFWLGICFLIEPITLFFIVLIYLSVYLFKKITLHTVFAPILGFIVPLILYISYLLWQDENVNLLNEFNFLLNFETTIYSDTKYATYLMFILVVTFLSFILKSKDALSINNSFRKSWLLLAFNFVLGIFLILLNENKGVELLIFILFPVSIIITNGIEMIPKKLIKSLALFILLFGCLFFSFYL